MLFFKKVFRKKMKPRDIRARYGVLSITNVTPLELNQGVERQWRKFHCRKFQDYELQIRLNQVFPESKSPIEVTAECDCTYCLEKDKSLLNLSFK